MSSLPVHPVGLVPTSSPSSSAGGIRSAASPAQKRRPPPLRRPASRSIAARSTTSTRCGARPPGPTASSILPSITRRLSQAISWPRPMRIAASSKPWPKHLPARVLRWLSLPARSGSRPDALQRRKDEPDIAHLPEGPAKRAETAKFTASLASRGIRSVVVRLSPTVHGEGDYGFMARIIGIARDTGVSGYIGDGSNEWPAVHVIDAAHLFRLALENAPAGSVLHAVADEGVPLRDIAEVVGRRLNVPVSSVSPADAPAHFSWLAGFLGMNSPASSTQTRELMKWRPMHPGLIEDLDNGHYFDRPATDKY